MKNISADELIKLWQKNRNLTVINVLPKESYEKEHIKGSVNIPLNDPRFVDLVKSKFSNLDQIVVVHCSSFDCKASTKAAMQLEAAGYHNVHDFKGGIQEWREAGQEFETFANQKS